MIRDTKQFLDQLPSTLRPILLLAMQRFQLGEMSIHGPVHWLRVYQNAKLLSAVIPAADELVCQLFALLHDSERRNESFDPEHGPRAAAFAAELHQQNELVITETQLQLLCDACIEHDRGKVSDDPTIGVCWDADRLDLPRVGIRVDQRYLSTQGAKKMV